MRFSFSWHHGWEETSDHSGNWGGREGPVYDAAIILLYLKNRINGVWWTDEVRKKAIRNLKRRKLYVE